MNLKERSLHILVLLLIITLVIGQTTQKPKKKKAKKRPASTKNRAFCLTCISDFKTKPFDQSDPCLNPLSNITDSELRYFNMCPEAAKYCMVEIATINGVFVGIERRCTSSCSKGCIRDGYGAENENCIYCCEPYLGSEYFDEEAIMECPRYESSSSSTKFNQIELWTLPVFSQLFCLLTKRFIFKNQY